VKILYEPPGASAADEAVLRIVPSGFFGERYGRPESLPQIPLAEIDAVPLLYGGPEIERESNQLTIHTDLVASTYFLVTRYEEVVRRDVRDEHGRFPGRESLPFRAGFLDRPIVDEYATLLRGWLRELGVNVAAPSREFTISLTHDVDVLRKYSSFAQPLRMTANLLRGHQSLADVGESWAVLLGLRRDPIDVLDELIRLDGSIVSGPVPVHVIYFFLAGGETRYEGRYAIASRAARKAIQMVRESGATIGLHPSYSSGKRPELIADEKQRLERNCGTPVRYSRFHYLAWREIEDGYALADAGITDDYTLGYADVAGFRLGVCRPIPLFDPVRCQPMGIREHPLIVMDVVLSAADRMALNENSAFQYCKQLIDETRKHAGEFVMLWHSHLLAPGPDNYHPQLYRRLLTELTAGAATLTL
jgi:hypothetical protein